MGKEYISKIPISIFDINDYTVRLVLIIKYLYDNTTRLNKCNFTLDHIVRSLGYLPNRNPDGINNKIRNELKILSENGIIKGELKSKVNDVMEIELLLDDKYIEITSNDYNTIYDNFKNDLPLALSVYCFYKYCNDNGIVTTQDYCGEKLNLSKQTINKRLSDIINLGLLDKNTNKCSFNESRIIKILEDNKISFVREYRFKDYKEVENLPFDFYIPGYNLCIEYDGEHHFKPVRFGGISLNKANENYNNTIKNDNIKNGFCEMNGIKLLRIPYTQVNILEDIILGVLNN